MAYINPPGRIPFILKTAIRFAEKKVGKKLLAARILTWYPKAAIGAGLMEALVAHDEGRATKRLLQLIRMQVSFMASCPFCIDMNSSEFSKAGITEKEIEAIQEKYSLEEISTFSEEEKTALLFTRSITATPIKLDEKILAKMKAFFSEKEFVVISSTIAQVNFWTRFIQGIGVPPAGFSKKTSIMNFSDYQTLIKKKL
ncbi:MAG: carboxymuconolactone decarboxylase family protein [Proteobacteria bacterium]|nr:carboxymuconolactone decarboxylase family protein [Pseudomonadota bacterium]MBU1386267.1 carboxymuconolactone decarboxylase family protein [Pseudomonadota bacterium]MBU1542960.1 carboxymuconolactone decarboxylase family protein [Pseudomonadota bacterium]MBU2431309.1 carboxymuconolactone decarboxylase family protein [Pseudomonadota bacterium]MBU2479982.1 carboxymuconolactone decarboxylase family protein [Pseudomonadota bacterium]